MYWLRVLEGSSICRAVGAVISAAMLVGAAWHGIGALVRLLF